MPLDKEGLAAVEQWIPNGTTIDGRWRILGPLGSGGFGQVLLVEDVSEVGLGQAAIKVLHPGTSPQERRDFLQEVKKIAVLRHQNLVGYLDSGQLGFPSNGEPGAADELRPYLVTELCERSLHDHIASSPGTRLPEAETLALLADVAAGLAHLHERGLIHRDIKPGNVLYADGRWKLADFGLMRDLSATGTYHRGELLMGTPIFMAPELFTTMTATPPSDVYAFGLLAHLSATGRALHTGAGSALVHNIAAVTREIDPGLDPRLGELIEQCTDPRPEVRPTAHQLAETLHQRQAMPPRHEPAGPMAVLRASAAPTPIPAAAPAPVAAPPFSYAPAAASGGGGPSDSTGSGDSPPGSRPRWLVPVAAGLGTLVLTAAATIAVINAIGERGTGSGTDSNSDSDSGDSDRAIASVEGGDDLAGPTSSSPTSPSLQTRTDDDSTPGDGGPALGVEIDAGVGIGAEVIIGDDRGRPEESRLEPVVDPASHLDPVPCSDGAGRTITVTNLHATPVDYELSVDHFDATGARIEESYETVDVLLPGRSALIILRPSEEDAASCKIESLTATPTPVEVQAAVGYAEIVSCDLNEFFGNWYEIVYTVENPTDVTVTASTSFGILDAEGVRIDGSFANHIYEIDPGGRARGETTKVFSNIDHTDREPVECIITRNELSR